MFYPIPSETVVPENHSSSSARQLSSGSGFWIWMFTIWTIPAVLSTLRFHLELLERGNPSSFWGILVFQLPVWYAWIPLTLFILWLGDSIPFTRAGWPKALALHLPMSIVLVTVNIAWYAFLFSVTGSDQPFSQVMRDFLFRFFQWYLMVYWAIISVSQTLTTNRRFRLQEMRAFQLQTELAEAKLEALRLQLRPHFLFNALNAAAGQVRKGEQREAVAMINGLSELLRQVLAGGQRPTHTLAEELAMLDNYLAIEKVRFGDRLHIRQQIHPQTRQVMVPAFILQPLAENAVKHGIEQRKGPGFLEIETLIEGEHCRISIRDNGPGHDADAVENVGLSNTRSRLQHHYGREDLCTIRDLGQGGTEVVILIPLEERPEDD